jgi:hypothetical protein
MSSIANVHIAPHVQPLPAAAPSPTQQVIADANRIEYVVDDLGRNLGFTRWNAKLRRRVIKVISAEQGAKNEYVFMAMVVCSCVSIDGTPVPFPVSELQVDALVDRLEQEGINALGLGQVEKFPPAEKDDVKNS